MEATFLIGFAVLLLLLGWIGFNVEKAAWHLARIEEQLRPIAFDMARTEGTFGEQVLERLRDIRDVVKYSN